jgi:hypothetical protein
VKHVYDVAQLDCIAVKGKTIGLHIYAIAKVGEKHQQYLDAYYSGDWERAKQLCQELKETGDSNTNPLQEYYKLMLERLQQGKPSNWDGVYHATSK